jgi:Kef-type K+ transport system membrane component KefB
MHILEFIRIHLLTLSGLQKAIAFLAIIAGVPALSRRLKLPPAVGLLLAGVAIGPHGIGSIPEQHPVAQFFGELGKLLLMFSAGLEINLDLFLKARNRTLLFGLLTTMVPQLLGTAVGLLFGYGFIPAVVIGSLLASHTLLGLPTIIRLGETHLDFFTVTVSATMISDTLSLVVFAVCASTFRTGFSSRSFGIQLLEISIFVPFILLGLSRLGRWLLNKAGNSEDAYFVVMLVVVVIASIIAEAINLPGIVGAFLAGLAVNAETQHKPAKEKLAFFGSSIFIPCFFIVTGFLISPVTFLDSIIGNFSLVASVVLALLIGKGIAAEVAGKIFHYTRTTRKTMWSLTLPQVAATLAAALVAHETLSRAGQRLLDDKMLNVVLVLMVTTAILGPVLTERFATELVSEAEPPHALKAAAGK